MKKHILLTAFAAALLLVGIPVKGQLPDTVHVIAQNKVHMNWYGSFNSWAVFPPDTNSYRKVTLNFTLGCPSPHCSGWDYTVDIYLNHNTHIKDSAYTKAPSFTVNGSVKDTAYVKRDTTYITYYDTTTHVTDSTANIAYTIVQYKDSLTPATPTDTVHWWAANYYNRYYNAIGNVIDSILVPADTTMYVNYYYYYRVYDSIQSYEIARTITPYGSYYGSTWTHPYTFDVTDFDWMMHDSVQIEVFYSGWSDGFLATCDFEMITGIPPHKAYKTVPLWTGTFPYGNASNPISNYLVPRAVKIDSAASAVRLRILQTGHGEDANNCSEFCAAYQHVLVNGTQHYSTLVWRDVCGLNPLYHQSGTWLYNRANWCPGEQITPYLDDLSPYITPSQTDTIQMTMDPYTSPNGGSVYTIGAELVYYGPINFSLDASLDDILMPTSNPLYGRMNPSCGPPEVVIRNTGSTPITSLEIVYGALGGVTNTYHWTGNLFFDDTALVTLPAIDLWTNSPTHLFRAKVIKPNGMQDQYSNNDSLVTPFNIVPNYPSQFIIQLSTNNAASEDSYFIADDAGHVVYQRSGFANSKTYKDTVNLTSGCYHFELDDAGEDGLSYWANSDGNGSLTFYHVSPHTVLQTFQPDFGTSLIQNFTVGAILGNNEIQPTTPTCKVYPNPANTMLNVQTKLSKGQTARICLYNSLGKRVRRVTVSSNRTTINTTDLPSGIYYYRITDNSGNVLKADKQMITH